MKILITTDIPVSFTCGSTTFIRNLALLMRERGHEVAYLCPGPQFRSTTFFTPEGFKVYGVHSVPTVVQKNLRVSLPFVGKGAIGNAIDDFKPDVIHLQSHFFLPAEAIKAARKRNISIIATNHFIPENVYHHLHLPKKVESVLRYAGWKHLHSVFGSIPIVTTPTETAARFMRESGFPVSVEPISNGITLSRFTPKKDEITREVEERYQLRKDRFRLLYVGRIDPEKHIEYVLEALPLVLQKREIEFIVAGRGAKMPSLKALADSLNIQDSVRFLGFVPDQDLPHLYRLADCFILPGTAELQSIATMEAMASGLPVIAANALALPELVTNDTNGFLFEPGNKTDLAEKILRVVNDGAMRSRMGKESLTKVQKHDINGTIETFEKLYRKVTASSSEGK